MRKSVEIQTEDKVRHLKYGMNALINLEQEMGRPLSEIGNEQNTKLEDLRTMFYVGLKHEDKDLTQEQVGDIMDYLISVHGMNYLSEKLAEAMDFGNSAMPSEK